MENQRASHTKVTVWLLLDWFARPQLHFLDSPWPSFQVCGIAGLSLAVLLTMLLAAHRELSPWILTVVAVAAVATFLSLAMITKIITGSEILVYYHHEIAVTAVAAAVLRLWRQPVLPYLDLTVLGLGLFLACGRVGCLMVGCCHGRPHRWGVCYRPEHAEAGFTPYYVGVRLFPVQAVEALWVLGTAAFGGVLVWSGARPGEALSCYGVMYSLGRFFFEFLRGDPERPYLGGFSEAQWTSLFLLGAVLWGGIAGAVPFHWWHVAAAAAVASWMLVAGILDEDRILRPRHVREIAQVVGVLRHPEQPDRPTIYLGSTSQGIQVSASRGRSQEAPVHHYALSCPGTALTAEAARALAGLIVQLERSSLAASELIRSSRGVFHLRVRTPVEPPVLKLS